MNFRTSIAASVLAVGVFTAAALAQDPAPPQPPGYAWADSCRSCHQAIYDAWAKTKHATALDRLSGGEQEKECIGCHVTGPRNRVLDGRKVLNRGVQCEACHGAGAAHAADPTSRTGLVKVPPESRCQQCHNDRGPHFRGFWYDAMKSFSHKTS